jgi:hypothetical protein
VQEKKEENYCEFDYECGFYPQIEEPICYNRDWMLKYGLDEGYWFGLECYCDSQVNECKYREQTKEI